MMMKAIPGLPFMSIALTRNLTRKTIGISMVSVGKNLDLSSAS